MQPIKQLFQKTLPEKYRKFIALFSKIKGPEVLPKHQPWDHTIPLQEGKQLTFRLVYSCLEKELEALHEYLDENLAKEFI